MGMLAFSLKLYFAPQKPASLAGDSSSHYYIGEEGQFWHIIYYVTWLIYFVIHYTYLLYIIYYYIALLYMILPYFHLMLYFPHYIIVYNIM